MKYIINESTPILLPKKAVGTVVCEIINNYLYNKKIEFSESESETVFSIGNFERKPLLDSDFVINVTENGVYIEGKDYPTLMKGIITFLSKIKLDHSIDSYCVDEFLLNETPDIAFRCVHLCVFPETDLYSLKKYVRSAGLAKYSHIILEFWGMLKYDCMKELAWKFAYSKDEIKEIVKEANLLGMEIIPMFNHLGHASSGRESVGKHVVLDQNPSYEYLFQSYGWIWNFNDNEVKELLRKIRKELIEICGDGKYFHIGCDEAYALGRDKEQINSMVKYINEVACELEKEGRRAIMWHDMLLSHEKFEGYVANSSDEISNILLSGISKKIIIADWQYDVDSNNWKTSQALKEHGFDVVCCPWDSRKNVDDAISTVKNNKLMGIIETTWHTMYKTFRVMIYAGICSFKETNLDKDTVHRFYCAEVVRKAIPCNGDYKKSGWNETMIGGNLSERYM